MNRELSFYASRTKQHSHTLPTPLNIFRRSSSELHKFITGNNNNIRQRSSTAFITTYDVRGRLRGSELYYFHPPLPPQMEMETAIFVILLISIVFKEEEFATPKEVREYDVATAYAAIVLCFI